jgi:hypothetical protein
MLAVLCLKRFLAWSVGCKEESGTKLQGLGAILGAHTSREGADPLWPPPYAPCYLIRHQTMLPEEFKHKETVYVAREDGCACRYIKNREGFLTRTEDCVRLMVDVISF